MWLGGLDIAPQTEGSPVRFPVWAHAWVVGQVPGWGRAREPIDVSLAHMFLSLSSLPSKNEFKNISKNVKNSMTFIGKDSPGGQRSKNSSP